MYFKNFERSKFTIVTFHAKLQQYFTLSFSRIWIAFSLRVPDFRASYSSSGSLSEILNVLTVDSKSLAYVTYTSEYSALLRYVRLVDYTRIVQIRPYRSTWFNNCLRSYRDLIQIRRVERTYESERKKCWPVTAVYVRLRSSPTKRVPQRIDVHRF